MTSSDQGLNGFLHSLLPVALRTRLKPNTAAYIRARALTVMLLAITAMALLYVLTLTAIHLAHNPTRVKWDLLLISLALILVLQTVLFYRYNNYWISGLAFTNFYFLAVMGVLVLNGGYSSAGKSILLTCPLVSFAVGSRQEGIQTAGVSIVYFWILVFLYSIGFTLPNFFATQDEHVIFTLNWIFTLAVIALTLAVYETELLEGDKRPQQGRREHLTRQDTDVHGMRAIGKQLELQLHRLLPAQLRSSLVLGSMDYVRGQILTILLLVATGLSVLAAALVLGVDLILQSAQIHYDVWIVLVGPCFALQVALFYRYANIRLSGAILGYYVFGVIVGIVMLTGAYTSPMMVLMLICPVGFFMTNGIRSGVLCAGTIAIIGMVLAGLDDTGVMFTDFFHDEARPITAGIAWLITIIAFMVCMLAYDNRLEKL